MVASDIYTIAKALSKEEFIKLSNMLRSDINKAEIKLKKKNKLPDFTEKDALRYLLNNHIKKNRTNRTNK
ncbi:hypothetical protein H9W90_06520 [Polaribacter pectinis]|uniref:Uncharacterized protein n=1 Tax=Polaribacter pectinis TaxID=2738844 RepID=A0A7G9LDR7_9FLAO|nr:hypothetical protein [Polaribacter pectinis]QNM86766.1 hypothetical protein H9W90_06520 [Polaribacter pectinis]